MLLEYYLLNSQQENLVAVGQFARLYLLVDNVMLESSLPILDPLNPVLLLLLIYEYCLEMMHVTENKEWRPPVRVATVRMPVCLPFG